MATGVDAREFLEVTAPLLRGGDAQVLARAVAVRWRARDLCGLLRHEEVDVRRVAAVTLGLVGDHSMIACLTMALRDADAQVNQMAEHALWSIWFRSGEAKAAQPFREGVSLLATESYPSAIICFKEAQRVDPLFAEAFNQCAIAHFFLHQWHESLECSRRAMCLIPTHFGAIASMGHCFTQLGDLRRAVACYRRALQINPGMSAISCMVERVEKYEHHRNDHSGIYVAAQV